MSKLLTVFVIVLVIGLGFFFFTRSSETSLPSSGGEVTTSMQDGNNVDMSDPTSSSKYVSYTSDVLKKNKNKKRVLFFYANWCPTCRPADADFLSNVNQIPDDVVLIKINYNDNETDEEEKQLAKTYNITYQHTFVQIDTVGNEVAKWNGGQMSELLSRIK